MVAQALKVMIIGPYPLEEGKIVGGVEAVTSTLALALAAEQGIAQITVLCFQNRWPSMHRKVVNEKLQVWYPRGRRQLKVLTRTFLEALTARRIAAQLQVDVVHGQGIGSRGEVAIQTLLPTVITVHGLPTVEARLATHATLLSRIRTHLVDAKTQRILRRARVVISISNYDAQALSSAIKGQQMSIPNPISEDFFGVPCYESSEPRLVFAGVLTKRKNLEGLIRSFAITRQTVPEARLTIVGPASNALYAQEIRQQVSALSLDEAVEFKGHVCNDQLIHELQRCRGVVLFSHEETAPTILMQAMAMGKPVVATRVGGIPEMVNDTENGFLVDPGDERGCAERMTMLLTSLELCRSMGLRGHQIAAQRYNASAVARRTVEAYRNALAP